MATASAPCTVVRTSADTGGLLDKSGHEIVLRKKTHCPRLWTKKCGSKASRTGNPALSRCPLKSCRHVNASLETGGSLDEDARALSENARSLNRYPPSLCRYPRSVGGHPRSLSAYPRSLSGYPRSLSENARARPRGIPNWPLPRHTIGINGHSSEIEEAVVLATYSFLSFNKKPRMSS